MHPNQAYRVPKKTAPQIVEMATKLREQLQMEESDGLRADSFVELLNGLFAQHDRAAFDILPKDQMPEMGCFDPMQGMIKLREDVYDKACDGCSESLFTIVHECGHMELHGGQVFCRLERLSDEEILQLHRDYHSEEQADLYACALKLHPQNLKKLLNRKAPLHWISSNYKLPIYQLQKYIQRLQEDCNLGISEALVSQMELKL